MSSLAATQADGYYVPPEYFESGAYKKQSKNQFQQSQGHNQYLQKGVVRFELPYKGICQSCKQSIGRGTRYNANKRTTDQTYFSTPIYEFSMTCRTAGCISTFIIRTNPQERGFDYVEGITLQSGQELQLQGAAAETVQQEPTSSLDRLESIAAGKRQQLTEHDELKRLQHLHQVTSLQDADSNATVRAMFRKDRVQKKARLAKAASQGWRRGMEVLEATDMDVVKAGQVVFGKASEKERSTMSKVRQSSIFAVAKKKQPRRLTPAVASPVPSSSTTMTRYNTDAAMVPQSVPSSNVQTSSTAMIETAQGVHPTDEENKHRSNEAPSSSLSEMLAGYGSDSDDD